MSMSRSFFGNTLNQEQEKEDAVASASTIVSGINAVEEGKTKQTRGYNKSNTVLEVLDRDGRFSKFLRSLSSSSENFQDELSDPRNQITLFAPTDEAFEDFSSRYDLSHDETQRILKYHIIPDIIDEEDIKDSDAVATSLNTPELLNEPQRILIERKGSRLYLNYGIKVSEANIEARNGIIHVINSVLELPKSIPTQLDRYSDFSLFLKALEKSGLENEFKEPGLTVFVPNNFAFKSLGQVAVDYLFSPEGRKDLRYILLNHISPELIYVGDLKLPADGRDIRKNNPHHNREEFGQNFNERFSDRSANDHTKRQEPNHSRQRSNRNEYDERAPPRRNGQQDRDNGIGSRSQRRDRYEDVRSGATSAANLGKQNALDSEGLETTSHRGQNSLDYEDTYEAFDVYSVDYPSWVHGERLSLRVLTDYSSCIHITINRQARVIMADGIAQNGVIHAIDRVLLPRDVILPQLQWHEFNREQGF